MSTDNVEPQQEQPEKPSQETNNNEELLMEIPTYNFTLLFCGLIAGIGLGYIVYVFVEKDMVLWIGAAVGLLVARILEVTVFPQNVVQIWTPKSSVEMTQIPKWRDELQASCDFFVQSDMYDTFNTFVRSTAIYHYPNTNALVVQERFVKRKNWFHGQLFFNSPIGGAVAFGAGLIASAIWYLRQESVDQTVSLFIIALVVLVPVIVLVGCLFEVELRKRRFLSANSASDYVTNIPLHTVGKVSRFTHGGDFWKLWYVPPYARSTWTRAKLALKLLFSPVLVVFRFCVFVILLSKYNGAFAVFFWEAIVTILAYQAHVLKETRFLEPAMALAWLALLVNFFELWFCAPASAGGRGNSISVLGTNGVRKLELDHETRIPKERVKQLWIGFWVSAVLIGLSAILLTYTTDTILKDIVIYNFDNSWKQNYRANEKFIMCEVKEGRRLLDEDFLGKATTADIKTKYTSDYDALCVNRTYYALTFAVILLSIDWVFLLVLAVYWHTYDKYQVHVDYDNSQMFWHQYTEFFIETVPSKITWIGRIIGRFLEPAFWCYLNDADAEAVSHFLANNVPWYANLHANQQGAKELMPRLPDVDTDGSSTDMIMRALQNLKFSLFDF